MITHFVNCTNKTMRLDDTDSNDVLSLKWLKNDVEKVREIFDDLLGKVKKFIDKANDQYESVLVFCISGQTRSLCLVVCYLISRFRWSLLKTLEYLDYLRPYLEIDGEYFQELHEVAEQYEEQNELSYTWENDYKSPEEHREEEIIISNTFLNSKKNPLGPLRIATFLRKKEVCRIRNKKYVIWADKIKKAKRAKSERLSAKGVPFKGNRLCNEEFRLKIKKLLKDRQLRTEMDESMNLNEHSFIKLKRNKKQDIYNFFSKMPRNKGKRLGKKNNKSNSISKSTNAQDDISNVEEEKSDKLKKIQEKALKNSYINSFDTSLANNIKQQRMSRRQEQKKEETKIKKKNSTSKERRMLEPFGRLEKLEKPGKAIYMKNKFKEFRSVENNDFQNRISIKKRFNSSKERKPKTKKQRPDSIPLKGKLIRK